MAAKIRKQVLENNMLICGVTGSGKSYHFENVILPIIKEDSRQIIILDYKDEFKFPSHIRLNSLDSPVMLGNIMNGTYSKGRKPHILQIIAPRYDINRIDNVLFKYLNNCDPKILIIEEAEFIFQDFIHKKVPYYVEQYFRTALGIHNKGQNVILVSQYSRDIPSKILAAFQSGHIFFLPDRELQYLYDQRYLPHPDIVKPCIQPYKSWHYFDVKAYLMDEPQPFGTDEDDDES